MTGIVMFICWDGGEMFASGEWQHVRPRLVDTYVPVALILAVRSRVFSWAWENARRYGPPEVWIPQPARTNDLVQTVGDTAFGGTREGTQVTVGLLGTTHDLWIPQPTAEVLERLQAAGWGSVPS